MIVIPWSAILITRDIIVAIFAVAIIWFFSLLLRFGENIEKKTEWKIVNAMLFVALIILLFKWEIFVIL